MKRISKKNINQKLIGNSGSKLLIYFNKKYIIRKLSINKDTSTRLENQYKKIINFKKNKQIYVPEIYKSGYERFNFYYDMEYVNGENFPEFILRSNSKFSSEHKKSASGPGVTYIYCNLIFTDNELSGIISQSSSIYLSIIVRSLVS